MCIRDSPAPRGRGGPDWPNSDLGWHDGDRPAPTHAGPKYTLDYSGDGPGVAGEGRRPWRAYARALAGVSEAGDPDEVGIGARFPTRLRRSVGDGECLYRSLADAGPQGVDSYREYRARVAGALAALPESEGWSSISAERRRTLQGEGLPEGSWWRTLVARAPLGAGEPGSATPKGLSLIHI